MPAAWGVDQDPRRALAQLPEPLTEQQLTRLDRLTREAIDERLRVLNDVSGTVWRCVEELTRMRSVLPAEERAQLFNAAARGEESSSAVSSTSTSTAQASPDIRTGPEAQGRAAAEGGSVSAPVPAEGESATTPASVGISQGKGKMRDDGVAIAQLEGRSIVPAPVEADGGAANSPEPALFSRSLEPSNSDPEDAPQVDEGDVAS